MPNANQGLTITSINAWKEFVESGTWQDVDNELAVWEEQILADLADPSFDSQNGDMKFDLKNRVLYDEKLRGNLESIRRVRALPHLILNTVETGG